MTFHGELTILFTEQSFSGGGGGGFFDRDDDDDFRTAREEASRRAGSSGGSDMFSSIISAIGQKKSTLANEDIDEEGERIPLPSSSTITTSHDSCAQSDCCQAD
jgi:hypothetical protein